METKWFVFRWNVYPHESYLYGPFSTEQFARELARNSDDKFKFSYILPLEVEIIRGGSVG